MKENAHCLLCANPPAHVQGILGIDSEGATSQCSVFACDSCREELNQALERNGRIVGILTAIWALTMLILIVTNPFAAMIAMWPLVIGLTIALVLLEPKSLKLAKKNIREIGVRSGVKLRALTRHWIDLNRLVVGSGCSRCQAESPTHQCELEGLTHVKTSHYVVATTNTYSTLRVPVPLCTACAADLSRVMRSSQLLRWLGPAAIAGTIAWMIFDDRHGSVTMPGGGVSIEFVESCVIFLVLFSILFLAMRLFTRRVLELPWISSTDAYRLMRAEGCGETQANIVCAPAPLPIAN